MAELYLSGPDSVTLTKTDAVPAEVFAGMADALAHVALEVTPRYITLPLRDPSGWLWYFADPASPVVFDDTLIEHLRHRVQEDGVRLNILAQRPEDQAHWPSRLAGVEDLGITRALTPPQGREVARLIALGGGANFSVPGSGKTSMTYALYSAMKQLGEVEQMLVLAPISAHEAWKTEPRLMYAPGAMPSRRRCEAIAPAMPVPCGCGV